MTVDVSVASMGAWVLQLRGDFPGICLNLLAIRLLLSHDVGSAIGRSLRRPGDAFQDHPCRGAGGWVSVVAGSTPVEGFAEFAALGTISSAGPYLLFFAREPRMLSQMLALSPGVVDVSGWLKLIRQAGSEVVVPLAILGLSSVAFRGSRWALVAAFAAISSVLAGLLDLQAGG